METLHPDVSALAPGPFRLHDIVPTHLAIRAMRDNGYKNAAYALAELMDNAIQAGARRVELLAAERSEVVQQRHRARLHHVAVLDDGCGMDADTLRLALQFGNGTRLDPANHDGIGRFGMGLPSASISQCTRVDVWSWQDGPDAALHSFLDLDAIAAGRMVEVPEPTPEPIPPMWRAATEAWGASGTLVVWSRLDRMTWRSARALFDNSELVVGRMYRKFLDASCPADRRVAIRFAAFDVDHPAEPGRSRTALPNDPGYLMARTSCPAPWDAEPMFRLHSGNWSTKIRFRGEMHRVSVQFSVAKEEARLGTRNAGSTPHGQHAKKNIGVSIVRANRELELDPSWTVGYDPRERWWGVEIHFPPALDELFGVTNNKQSARHLHLLTDAELFEAGTYDAEEADVLGDEEDPRLVVREISDRIQDNLRTIRELIRRQGENDERAEKRKPRHATALESDSPEQHATLVARQRREEEGIETESDRQEALPAEERVDALADVLRVEADMPVESARALAAAIVEDGLKFEFVNTRFESAAFFSVERSGGVLLIKLNTTHPAYRHLVETLERDAGGASEADLRERLEAARDGLRLLLMAWARYEDEASGPKEERLRDVRSDWGRIARDFLSDGEE